MITLKSAKTLDRLGVINTYNGSMTVIGKTTYTYDTDISIEELLSKLPKTITMFRDKDGSWETTHHLNRVFYYGEHHKSLAEALSRLLIRLHKEGLCKNQVDN